MDEILLTKILKMQDEGWPPERIVNAFKNREAEAKEILSLTSALKNAPRIQQPSAQFKARLFNAVQLTPTSYSFWHRHWRVLVPALALMVILVALPLKRLRDNGWQSPGSPATAVDSATEEIVKEFTSGKDLSAWSDRDAESAAANYKNVNLNDVYDPNTN